MLHFGFAISVVLFFFTLLAFVIGVYKMPIPAGQWNLSYLKINLGPCS